MIRPARRCSMTAAVLVIVATAIGGSLLAAHGAAATAPPTAGDQPGDELELGLAPLLLVAPATTGAGGRPEFSWQPVPGAAAYLLSVVTEAGQPLWSWTGTETSVILGGWPSPPPPVAPGPLITAAGHWFVVASDAAGVPIANSVLRPISP